MGMEETAKLLMPDCDDNVREAFLGMAERDILNFCNIESVPAGLEDVQLRIAMKYYNRWGKEGATAYTEGGQSQTFDDILTTDIKENLYAYRKLRW